MMIHHHLLEASNLRDAKMEAGGGDSLLITFAQKQIIQTLGVNWYSENNGKAFLVQCPAG